MLILALLLAAVAPGDSLPPIPDVARFVFPEPPLFAPPESGFVYLHALIGRDYRAGGGIGIRGLTAMMVSGRNDRWQPCRTDSAGASYTFSISRLLCTPRVLCFRGAVLDTQLLIRPSAELSIVAPGFIAGANAEYGLWNIDGQEFREGAGELSLIFDRAPYLPELDIGYLRSGETPKPSLTGSIHLNRLHASVGSLMPYGFPSPRIFLSYRTPLLTISGSIGSGVDHHSLGDIYLNDNPFHPLFPVPDESLRIRADCECVIDRVDHRLHVGVTYRNNKTRLAVRDNFEYGMTGMVEEAAVFFAIDDRANIGMVRIRDSLTGRFSWFSAPLPYQPDCSANVMLEIRCGIVSARTELSFISERPGVNRMLPSSLLWDPQCGITFSFLTVYAAVMNATDVRTEYYEGFRLSPRSYAAGIKIETVF